MGDDRTQTQARSRPPQERDGGRGRGEQAPKEGRDRHDAPEGRGRRRNGARDEGRRDDHEGRQHPDQRDERRPRRRVPSVELVERAKTELAALIGREVDSTSGLVERDGGWCVTVEMLELERIPPTTSVLGSYEVQLDDRGEVLGFERVRRYMRSDAHA